MLDIDALTLIDVHFRNDEYLENEVRKIGHLDTVFAHLTRDRNALHFA